ncbi:hypothetical protein [Candidatus Sororendozoicomonas aggregata]|uniref:hypothetical protein n=1 Tax=Candidatus Sororendozoicomonas aggregata TaxID=3073239 RepID=UPI002ED23D08
MSMTSILWVGKSMAEKSFVLFILFFCLSIIGKAYSSDAYLKVENKIAPGQKYYSKKGYTVKASGKGRCMYGVYSRATCTVLYNKGACKVGIHYASVKNGCAVKDSWQDFEVINNDTGHVVGKLRWVKEMWSGPYLKLTDNPGAFMTYRTFFTAVSGVLNLWTGLS